MCTSAVRVCCVCCVCCVLCMCTVCALSAMCDACLLPNKLHPKCLPPGSKSLLERSAHLHTTVVSYVSFSLIGQAFDLVLLLHTSSNLNLDSTPPSTHGASWDFSQRPGAARPGIRPGAAGKQAATQSLAPPLTRTCSAMDFSSATFSRTTWHLTWCCWQTSSSPSWSHWKARTGH